MFLTKRNLCSIITSLCLYAGFFFNSCDDRRTSESAKSDQERPDTFGYGRVANAAEIDSLNIDVSPDGTGLPVGQGNVHKGRKIYEAKCALCHGKTGQEGPYNKLVIPFSDSDSTKHGEKAIGNYWPYATTLYDYINRAMPYNSPGTLTPEEVYSLTAYLLCKNNIVDSTAIIDQNNLAKIEMPARKLFINDDRKGGPEVR